MVSWIRSTTWFNFLPSTFATCYYTTSQYVLPEANSCMKFSNLVTQFSLLLFISHLIIIPHTAHKFAMASSLDQSYVSANQSFQCFYSVLFVRLWVLIILKILQVVVLMVRYDISLSVFCGVQHTITSMWCTLDNILCIKKVYNSWHMTLI